MLRSRLNIGCDADQWTSATEQLIGPALTNQIEKRSGVAQRTWLCQVLRLLSGRRKDRRLLVLLPFVPMRPLDASKTPGDIASFGELKMSSAG